jgi:hypothetical protein
VLDFLTKYFVVLSAGAVAVGSSLVVIFIYGYLAVFDWNLIWIIEYQDITKFTLIAIALGVTVLPTLSVFGSTFHSAQRVNAGMSKQLVRILIVSVIALGVWSAWFTYYHQRSVFEYYVMFWTLAFVTIVLIAGFNRVWPDWPNKSRLQQALIIGAFLGYVGLLGTTFGFYVREISNNRQDIYTSGETFTDQKIVILLSHHSIFYKDGIVTVVQSSDIKKILLKPSIQ